MDKNNKWSSNGEDAIAASGYFFFKTGLVTAAIFFIIFISV
jgi:hypothetical protein